MKLLTYSDNGSPRVGAAVDGGVVDLGERFDSMSGRFADIAARRASQGVPIEQSLLAYEIGFVGGLFTGDFNWEPS